jgi:hypothetical protein
LTTNDCLLLLDFEKVPAGGGGDANMRCCYITVDSAMAASQNGFCSYTLFVHNKTNIRQIMTKNITFFINLIFYHRKVVKLDHFYNTFIELCKHRSVMQPLQNPPFCSSTEYAF